MKDGALHHLTQAEDYAVIAYRNQMTAMYMKNRSAADILMREAEKTFELARTCLILGGVSDTEASFEMTLPETFSLTAKMREEYNTNG